jgi:hypothetical protein
MGTRNIFLVEKGFGFERKGNATVIAGSDGQMLTLRPVVLPDKRVGGELVIIPLNEIDTRRKRPYINTEKIVYEVSVTRSVNFKNIGGKIHIREIDAETLETKMYESPYYLQKDRHQNDILKCLVSENAENSKMAEELITGKLFSAFQAAFKRSTITRPESIYFGLIDTSADVIVREKFKPEVKQEELATV